jgi:hypothetical protein
VQLFHVGLTEDQCKKYRLPRTPIKEGERRAARFEERFGEGATELDALESLHPGELGKILSDALGQYFDADLAEEVESARDDHQDDLDHRRDGVLTRHQEAIDELQQDHAALRTEVEGRMKAIRDRAASLWQAISDELIGESFNLSVNDIPEAAKAEETENALYDSSRDYMGQLGVYKQFQGKATA